MGITIHYAFMMRDRDAVLQVLKEIKDIAVKLKMKIVDDSGMSLVVHPHPNCETLNLEFKKWFEVKQKKGFDYCKATLQDYEKVLDDKEFVCSDFTKTQYAGYKTHILVAEMLRKVASRCTLAYVYDEADYYETRNLEKTAKNFDESSKMIGMIAGVLKEIFGKDNVYCAIDDIKDS
jgi:hypothetical protein